MRLTPSDRDTSRIVSMALAAMTLIVSVFLAILFGQAQDRNVRTELRERSQSIAAALGPDEVMRLKGMPSDAATQTYKDLKSRLADIKKANHSARSMYLMGQHNDRLFFYVDSEQPSSDDYSPAAEWYDDATPALKSMFTTGDPLVEGPISDDFGTFISGLAPIFKPGTTEVVAIVGIDVEAATYWRDVALAGAIPLLTGIGVVMIILVFEWRRRRNQQLLALRSELVSVASHELRNPITGIRWAAETLHKMTADPKLAAMIASIHSSAVRLQTSTDDILELSHAINHKRLALEATDLTKLIQDVIGIQELSAQQRGVRIVLDPSWPASVMVQCDAGKIKRAMHNVVSNAVKYTRDNTEVTISYKAENNLHCIAVADQGIGIPAAEQSKVFHGFYRASNAVRSNIPGTGFGLYLVKAVFEQHRGKVSFVSEEGKGTVFTLCLPGRD